MVSVTDDKAKRHKNPDHICLCLQLEIASERTKSLASYLYEQNYVTQTHTEDF